jgi:hypothetical protein
MVVLGVMQAGDDRALARDGERNIAPYSDLPDDR